MKAHKNKAGTLEVDFALAAPAWLERSTIIPGRSLTRSKAPAAWGDARVPPTAVAGVGAYLYDWRGRPYIDMLCGLGAVSLGYAPLRLPAAEGVYSLPSEDEVLAAEAVRSVCAPWATRVRFTKTGSEATYAALRVARLATGRIDVWTLKGAYHGWYEWPLSGRQFELGQSLDEIPGPLPAAVFLEPPRWDVFSMDWIEHLREWCTRRGALLVFDEMIWGCRWAHGGLSELAEVTPDLACYGKAIANGRSIACVVGTDALEAHGTVASGTYSGEVGPLLALQETLSTYRQYDVIDHLWERGTQLFTRLYDAEIPVEGAAVHQRIRFTSEHQGHLFAGEMATRGVLWHPACTNLMYAHTKAIIDEVADAAETSWRKVQ